MTRSPLPLLLRACAPAALTLAILAAPAAIAAEPSTQRMSTAADGTAGNDGSHDAVVSGNGRFVAFVSSASNLVPGDTNNAPDVFVKDRVTGAIERVNVGSDGSESQYGGARPDISADGRVVVFDSQGIDDDTIGDVFVRDLEAGTTTRIRPELDEGQGSVLGGVWPHISSDGSTVVFQAHVFYRPFVAEQRAISYDLSDGTTRVLTIGDGTEFDRTFSTTPAVDADGNMIVARVGGPGDFPTAVYAFEGESSRKVVEGQANQFSLSDDGRMLGYLAPRPGQVGQNDFLVRDLESGTTHHASVGPAGEQLELVVAGEVSPSGRTATFGSRAPEGGNSRYVYLRDLAAQTSEQIDVQAVEEPDGTHFSHPGTVSADDRFVAFQSFGRYLVEGNDDNERADIFLRDRGAPDPPPPAAQDPLCSLLNSVLGPLLSLAGLPPLDC